jgi:hypothetical protein
MYAKAISGTPKQEAMAQAQPPPEHTKGTSATVRSL